MVVTTIVTVPVTLDVVIVMIVIMVIIVVLNIPPVIMVLDLDALKAVEGTGCLLLEAALHVEGVDQALGELNATVLLAHTNVLGLGDSAHLGNLGLSCLEAVKSAVGNLLGAGLNVTGVDNAFAKLNSAVLLADADIAGRNDGGDHDVKCDWDGDGGDHDVKCDWDHDGGDHDVKCDWDHDGGDHDVKDADDLWDQYENFHELPKCHKDCAISFGKCLIDTQDFDACLKTVAKCVYNCEKKELPVVKAALNKIQVKNMAECQKNCGIEFGKCLINTMDMKSCL